MAKKTSNGQKQPRKPAPMKKIGERVEKVVEKLSPMQLEDERSRACELMRERTALKEKAKAAAADWKGKIAAVDESLRESLATVESGRRDREVTVIEWLTPDNEVVRVRADTNEQIGKRTARTDELQEKLFDDGDDADPSDLPKPTESEASEEAAGEEAGEFGGDA